MNYTHSVWFTQVPVDKLINWSHYASYIWATAYETLTEEFQFEVSELSSMGWLQSTTSSQLPIFYDRFLLGYPLIVFPSGPSSEEIINIDNGFSPNTFPVFSSPEVNNRLQFPNTQCDAHLNFSKFCFWSKSFRLDECSVYLLDSNVSFIDFDWVFG